MPGRISVLDASRERYLSQKVPLSPRGSHRFFFFFPEQQGAEWRPRGGIWQEFWDLSCASLKLPAATSASNYTCLEGTGDPIHPIYFLENYAFCL